MYQKIQNISRIMLLMFAMFAASSTLQAQDIDTDRDYCDPLGGQNMGGFERNNGGFYPYSWFASITVYEEETNQEIWRWNVDCGQNMKHYEHLFLNYDTPPIEMKPNTAYLIEMGIDSRLNNSHAVRVYFDANEDEEFDQFSDDEYIHWSRERTQFGGGQPPLNCGVYNWPQIGWTNRTSAWDSRIFEFETDGKQLDTKETRFRFFTSYFRPSAQFVQASCENGWVWNGGRTRANYYGQVLDQTVIFAGCEYVTSPAAESGMLAQEVYNGITRQPKKGGDELPFDLPSVSFIGTLDEGDEMSYSIVGPFPDQTAVYKATDGAGNTWIDVSASAIDKTSNLEATADGFKWTAAFTPKYDGKDASWTKDENGRDLDQGGFYAYLTGEYAVRVEVKKANGEESDCGIRFFSFTVQADDDMTVSSVTSPRNYDAPFFRKYLVNAQYNIEAVYKNIGLKEVDKFQAGITIRGLDGLNYQLDDEVNYDKNNPNETVILPGQTRDIVFSKRFRPSQPGLYTFLYSMNSMEGSATLDQNQFNNYMPRPTGGNARDGWEFDNQYIVQVVYALDLVGGEVIFPLEDPTREEDFIIANRPFRPVVRFLNEGFDDAVNVNAVLEIRNSSNEVVAQIKDFVIEDIPSGRFNFADVRFDELVVPDPGDYTIWARIDNVNEVPIVIDEKNEVLGTFTVEAGISGNYTVGTKNAGEERNYNSIQEAMRDVYYFGMSGDVTYELTDEEYNLFGSSAAWDFRSTIIGLGYNEETDRTYSMTWKAAANRELIKGGVTINLESIEGYGVRFGQGIANESSPQAPVNVAATSDYVNFRGHITFDGGDVNALRFVMNSQSEFAAPFFLGQGTHDVTLNNLIIENIDENSHIDKVRLPLKSGDHTSIPFSFDEDRIVVDGDVRTYSAGIVNRNQLFNFDQIVEDEDFIGVPIDTVRNSDNVITGNIISDFGYGVVSLGLGGLFNIQNARYQNYNNENNLIENNMISNVGRAGIALGDEQNSTIRGNTITDVNPMDISDAKDGIGAFDHAGIMIGGLTWELVENDVVKRKGYHAKNIVVDGNKITSVHSNTTATGVKVEQNYLVYGTLQNEILRLPDGEENIRVSNNIIMDLNLTSNTANKVGIHLFTERQAGNFLEQEQTYPAYRSRNDKIVNNTIIINSNENGIASNGAVFGIGLQQVANVQSLNNAIAITDNSISTINEYAAAVFMQAPLPENNGPLNDNNAYYLSDNTGSTLVKLVEMNETTNDIEFEFSRDDFENLSQWSIFTGSDANSVEYNFMNDVDVTDTDVSIKKTNGLLPLGSKLNNRGRELSYLSNDKNGNKRGVTGERYDIGAEEFKGRLYTADVELVQISSPAAYKSTKVDVPTGNDFTNEEHIMTTAPVNVISQIRNDGSLQQNVEVTLTVSIESNTMTNEFNEIASFVKEASVGSTDDVFVDFGLDAGVNAWTPDTYSMYNNDSDTENDYTVPARYQGMEANVTPRIKLEVKVGSDENNGNNSTSKIVRFYLTRTETGVMLSVVDNNESLQSGVANKVGGALNFSVLQQGLLTGLNWKLNPSNGDYDYDLFDRNGWEKRAVDYRPYNIMYWSDGGSRNAGELNRYEIANVTEFLAEGDDQVKSNLVIASQDMARYADDSFNRDILGVSYDDAKGYPMNSSTSYTSKVVGVKVAQGFEIDVMNPASQPTDLTELSPYPAVITPNDAVPGRSEKAFNYHVDGYDTKLYPVAPTMGTALTTLTSNVIFFGIDWRHFGNISLAAKGIMDYLNTNGGFIVPIELANFEANQVDNNVMVEWATKSEENSSHFVVEKSELESGIFSKVTTVPAQGNKATETRYTPVYDDKVEFGKTYLYKLKMVDLDGSWEYSDTKEVTILGNGITLSEIKLTPNPSVNGDTKLNFYSTDKGDLTIEVYDMVGNLLLSDLYQVNSGNNMLPISLGNVANGAYNVVISTGDYSVTKSLNVTK
ncbi:right-handed parallel beta-helix repeat-containing protein [Candidatus Kapabacteria bacterium]|nr:right-handed parallel beta-helix repeat-containing protein [Candidatus Kapabacteria bacterium]